MNVYWKDPAGHLHKANVANVESHVEAVSIVVESLNKQWEEYCLPVLAVVPKAVV